MDKFTRESLYDMLDILKDVNPKKYKKKIELLEKRLKNEEKANSDNAEWVPGSDDDT